MSRINRLPVISFLLMLLLVSACARLQIPPPGPDQQTLLVLPVEVSNASRVKHGFSYVYEIRHVDETVPPYEATFKLPQKGDMLIVDSLPPGDYYVNKFISKKKEDAKIWIVGNTVEDRFDRFKLESGSVTIFSKLLDVRIVQNANSNTGVGVTTYLRNMISVSPIQKTRILETLNKLENFDKWSLLDTTEKVSANLEELLLDGGFRRLNEFEIRGILGGNTLHGSFENSTATIFLASEGQVRGKTVSSSGVVSRDQGTWKATAEGLFCDSWDFWRAGTDCDRVYVRGSTFVLINLDGTKSSEGKIEPGNHSDL